MNLIVIAGIVEPPTDTLALRYITQISKIHFCLDVLLEAENEIKDFYYKYMSKLGLFDYFSDIVPPKTEHGIRLDYCNSYPITIPIRKGVFFDNQLEIIGKIGSNIKKD